MLVPRAAFVPAAILSGAAKNMLAGPASNQGGNPMQYNVACAHFQSEEGSNNIFADSEWIAGPPGTTLTIEVPASTWVVSAPDGRLMVDIPVQEWIFRGNGA